MEIVPSMDFNGRELMVKSKMIGLLSCILLLLIIFNPQQCNADNYDYLDTKECTLVGGGSLVFLTLGHFARSMDTTRNSIIASPFPGELSISESIGGKYKRGRTNFLNSDAGAVYTPIVCAIMLTSANTTWPHNHSMKDAGEDLFVYTSGLAATMGVTSIFKGLIARPRPYMHVDPELAALRNTEDFAEDHVSFFSGHASSAFFSTVYLNKRIRSIMRREMSPGEYRDYRWVPPAVLFSWASFVGWSRIHAYQHYLSDVVIGSLVGWVVAELFFSLLDESDTAQNKTAGASPQMIFRYSFHF